MLNYSKKRLLPGWEEFIFIIKYETGGVLMGVPSVVLLLMGVPSAVLLLLVLLNTVLIILPAR